MIFEIILLTFTAFILWTININTGNKWKNRPPGPMQLPLIGNLHQMFIKLRSSKGQPFVALEKISAEYGPVTIIKIGIIEHVLVNDFNLVKEILNDEVWVDRNFDVLNSMRSFDKPLGVLFASGEEWKEMRRFTLRTLRDFGFGKHKDQESVYHEELEELTKILDTQLDKTKGKGQVVKMEQFFTISVLNILWSLVAGERFSHDGPKLLEMNDMTSKVLKFVTPGDNLLQAYPTKFFRFLLSTFSKDFQFIGTYIEFMHKFFQDILEKRRAQGYYKEDQRDFIDVFLKEIDTHKNSGEKSNFYHDNQFVVVMLDLFQAGSETTSNTLEFAILYMILNSRVQKKVQEEIDRVVGQNRSPSYATDRASMPYTEATIHEIQRMSCVLPLDNRNTNQETMLGEYFIKKGAQSIINIHSIHFNEKLWGDPLNFRPERFLDSQNNLVNTNKLIPFGGGKRLCLGESMARATLFTYFTGFLQNYNFEQVPNTSEPSSEPRVGFTLSPHPYDAFVSYRT